VSDQDANGIGPTGTAESQPKRGPGAPRFNQNGFKTGYVAIRRARKTKLRIRQRRIIVEVAARLTEDLGGAESLSEAQRLIVMIVSRQCGRLDKVHRVYDRLMRANPDLLTKPGALHRIDSAIAPMEQRLISNLNVLGLKRTAKVRDIFDWQTGAENGDGENGDGNCQGEGNGPANGVEVVK
jgi:hypothetical protein